MLRVHDIRLPLDHREEDLPSALPDRLGVTAGDILWWRVVQRSVDARHKGRIKLVYTVDAQVAEGAVVRSAPGVSEPADERYLPPDPGGDRLLNRPVVVGTGPAGMFAALLLARQGYRPLVLERGRPVERRVEDVRCFTAGGDLDPESNIQFGEGGAGTFSDGKLYTLIRDPRTRLVFEELAAAGAPGEILWSYRPHIGTDNLRRVVRALRERIVSLGGEVRFEAKVTDLLVREGALSGCVVHGDGELPAQVIILAVGHSARDTFAMLNRRGVPLRPKPFSLGLRIEHPQALVDRAQFGPFAGHPRLGAAEYKLVWHGPGGRSAYTFCMCPGGMVVAATSEEGCLVTNGMSEFGRDRPNANGALLVNVGPADFGSDHPLAGVEFQRHWERRAFAAGGGDYRAPVQRVADFLTGRPSISLGAVEPSYRPGVHPADLAACLPAFVTGTLRAALPAFDRRLRGFGLPDAVLTGVETRSSSPVTMERDAAGESPLRGLYPAGEGAGHAGGIVSAAVDGLRAAEGVLRRFAPPDR